MLNCYLPFIYIFRKYPVCIYETYCNTLLIHNLSIRYNSSIDIINYTNLP